MRITSFCVEPHSELPFLNAGRGQGSFYVDKLPIHIGQLDELPDELDAIIATADLQGRECFEDGTGGPPQLLGEVLPHRLAREILPPLGISPQRTGVLLAGDFFTVPNLDKRGGSGDVTNVWLAFARQFRWVVGVAGNHDTFGSSDAPAGRIASNTCYLDGDTATFDRVMIAGVSGIIGNPRKPHRKSDDTFATHLEIISASSPQIYLMHDGPDDGSGRQKGSPIIRNVLERLDPAIVIRGHTHWHDPLSELGNNTQVLNVDCRVAILRR